MEITKDTVLTFTFKDKDNNQISSSLNYEKIVELLEETAFENIPEPDCTSAGCNNESQNFCDCGSIYDNYELSKIELENN